MEPEITTLRASSNEKYFTTLGHSTIPPLVHAVVSRAWTAFQTTARQTPVSFFDPGRVLNSKTVDRDSNRKTKPDPRKPNFTVAASPL